MLLFITRIENKQFKVMHSFIQTSFHLHNVALNKLNGRDPSQFTVVVLYIITIKTIFNSVSDPYHFDADPDPRIRIRDDGSGS